MKNGISEAFASTLEMICNEIKREQVPVEENDYAKGFNRGLSEALRILDREIKRHRK